MELGRSEELVPAPSQEAGLTDLYQNKIGIEGPRFPRKHLTAYDQNGWIHGSLEITGEHPYYLHEFLEVICLSGTGKTPAENMSNHALGNGNVGAVTCQLIEISTTATEYSGE